MGIQVNNDLNAQNSVLNNLYSSVKGYTSQFLNTGTREFSSYLKDNFDTIDKDRNSSLSKDEVSSSVKTDVRNNELQKLIDNNNLEKMMSEIDTNGDGKITFSETNPNGNVGNLLKSSLREIQTNKNWGAAAQNLAQNLCKNYYASPMMASAAAGAVSALL